MAQQRIPRQLPRPVLQRVHTAASIDDIERIAQRRLPRMIFDFVQGGAEDELSLAANGRALADRSFLPRVLNDVSTRDQSTTILGQAVASPFLLAPVGLTGLVEPKERERGVARAAAARNIIYALSSSASTSIEDVRRASGGPLWLQLYVWRDRGLTRAVVDRAREAGYQALCVTVDVPVVGRRERDVRNGLTVPPRIRTRGALDVLRRPGWLGRLARYHALGERITFANFTLDAPTQRSDATTLGAFAQAQFDPSLSWSDIAWLGDIWPGPLVVKGVMRAEDARRCADLGAKGVVVSNHGGRQLDGAAAALDALPAVVEEVGGEVEVYLDGGIRRGVDVLRAVALGARACLVGRAYVYGLAAGGSGGVERVIDILQAEIDSAMALLGTPALSSVDRSLLAETAQ